MSGKRSTEKTSDPRLNARHARACMLRSLGWTYRRIAEELGVTTSRAREIVVCCEHVKERWHKQQQRFDADTRKEIFHFQHEYLQDVVLRLTILPIKTCS